MAWAKCGRWFLLYPALILGGLHMSMTGSPIPLWHLEDLTAPVRVKAVTGRQIMLEDGRAVGLPFIDELPHDNPLFQRALSQGIEISENGEAYGLLWLDRNCGNDPYLWKRIRVNLSDLAGALHPAGIDEAIVHPEAIAFLDEHKRIDLTTYVSSHGKGHLTLWDVLNLRAVRRDFEHFAAVAKEPDSDPQ